MGALILTAELDPIAFERLDGVRRAHFPPERNLVPAHLTLFHHLPAEERARVLDDLATVGAGEPPIAVRVERVLALRAGVAYAVHAPRLLALRAELAGRWAGLLGEQDRRPFRPHVTVQNKVEPEQARALHAALARELVPWGAELRGLLLWEYRGGPWASAGRVGLTGREPPETRS